MRRWQPHQTHQHRAGTLRTGICCPPSPRWRRLPLRSDARSRQRPGHTRCSAYDNPALYSNEDTFSERDYWDKRYASEPEAFEWYKGYAPLRPLLLRYLPPDLPILQLGMGTSTIHWDMVAEDGYKSILSVDYSPVCVEAQRATYAGTPQLTFEVADVRDMRGLVADGSFAGVLDKGTLDALLCGDNDVSDAARLLSEAHRVLEGGGVYLHVTHAPPASRLRYLGTESNGWATIEVWEVGQQGAMHGPYSVPSVLPSTAGPLTGAEAAAAGLPEAKEVYSHWVYCCRKRLELCGLRQHEP